MASREADAQREILRYLTLMRIFHIRVNTQGVPLHNGSGAFRPAPHRGVADILGIYQRRPLAIEVKSDTGRLTVDQRVFLAQFEAAGGIAFVARSAKDVEAKLAAAG
jgi:hypothetical protein